MPLISKKNKLTEYIYSGNTTEAIKIITKAKNRTKILANKDANGTSFLHLAAFKNNKEIVDALISIGIDINIKDKDGNTAIMVAAINVDKHVERYQSIEMILFLFDKGANPNSRNNNGQTINHILEKSKNWEDVKDLLDQIKPLPLSSEDIQRLNNKLITEAMGTNIKKIERLLAKGIDVNAKDQYGNTALIMALKYGSTINIVNALIKAGADVNAKDKYDKTALSWAESRGDHHIVNLIKAEQERRNGHLPAAAAAAPSVLASPASSGSENTKSINYQLLWAAQNGRTEAAMVLIAKGADINAVDKYGDTPLILAARNDDTEIALALIDKGADVNAMNKNGNTPLIMAAQNGRTEIVKALIAKGADVNAVNKLGYTPLIMAAQNGRTEAAMVLIAKGADVNRVDRFGNTPLFLAARNGDTEIAMALIAKGADVDAVNKNGYTPLILAARNGDTEIAMALIAKGADVDAASKNGDTALSIAENEGHESIVALIKAEQERRSGRLAAAAAAAAASPSVLSEPAAASSSRMIPDTSVIDKLGIGQVIMPLREDDEKNNERKNSEEGAMVASSSSSSASKAEKSEPDDFNDWFRNKYHTDAICPISFEVMKNPVFTANGQVYDRESIASHLSKSNIDPNTRTVLKSKDLTHNFGLKSQIEAGLKKYKEKYPENFAEEFEGKSVDQILGKASGRGI